MNKLYNMDCVEGMKLLKNNSVDLTVTSPPYDNLRSYEGNISLDIGRVTEQLYRVTKDGGVVVWVVADACINGSETGSSFRHALRFMDVGFNLHDTMIYLKTHLSFPEKNRYYQGFEYMFVFSKGKVKTFNPIRDKENVSSGKKVFIKERQRDGTFKTRPSNGRVVSKK